MRPDGLWSPLLCGLQGEDEQGEGPRRLASGSLWHRFLQGVELAVRGSRAPPTGGRPCACRFSCARSNSARRATPSTPASVGIANTWLAHIAALTPCDSCAARSWRPHAPRPDMRGAAPGARKRVALLPRASAREGLLITLRRFHAYEYVRYSVRVHSTGK